MNDLISRQAAIDVVEGGAELIRRVLDNMDVVIGERGKFAYGLGLLESCIEELSELPSAQPERKKGKWIFCTSSDHWKCDQCGCRAAYWFNEENSSSYELDMSEWLSDYCPNCGADMRGGDDVGDTE